LASGRKFRTANLKDDCTRECPAILVDFSLPGRRVTLMLDDVARERGYPDILVVDNGLEFTGRDLENWAHEHGVRLFFIDSIPAGDAASRPRRGKPMQNGSIESFNAWGPEAARRFGVGAASATNASIRTCAAVSTRPAGSSSAGASPTTKPGPTPRRACRRPKRSPPLDRSSDRGKRLRLQSSLTAHRRSRLPPSPRRCYPKRADSTYEWP